MCRRDRPILATREIGLLSVVLVVTAHNHPSTTHIPHREIGCVDLRSDLRQLVPLLPDGDPIQRRAPGRPYLRVVARDRVEEI